MRPDVDQMLGSFAAKLVSDLVPALGTQYGQGTTQIMALLLMLSAQEYDRAADIRLAENNDIRSLFSDMAPMVSEAQLRAELEAAAATTDESLRISALNASNEALRRLLIGLHAHAEEAGIDQRPIWNVLRAMAARRVLVFPAG
jgi:hypothetical protein